MKRLKARLMCASLRFARPAMTCSVVRTNRPLIADIDDHGWRVKPPENTYEGRLL